MRPAVLLVVLCSLLSSLLCGCAGPSGPSGEAAGPGPAVRINLQNADADVARQLEELAARIDGEPDVADHRAALGMAYEVAAMYRAALDCYDQAFALQPSEPRWSYYQAQARAELGDLEGALEAMDRVIALDDAYAPSWLFRGQWSLDLGRTEEADEAYDRATTLSPRDPAGWAGRARVHMRRGEPQQAAQVLERIVSAHPREGYFRQLLGLAYREAGDLERAKAALAGGKPTRDPGWPDPWHDEKAVYQTGFGADMIRAGNMMRKGKTAEAIELLEALRRQRPDDVAMLNNLSVAYRNSKQPDKAFEVLRAGLESHPEYFPFHFNISTDYQRHGDIEKALHHLDRAIDISPTLTMAYERKGFMLLGQKRYAEARDTFEAAITQGAAGAKVYMYIGVIEGEMANWRRAAERLEQAIRLDGDLTAAYIALGRSRAELGEFAAAEAALTRASTLSPDSEQLKKARARLTELKADRG